MFGLRYHSVTYGLMFGVTIELKSIAVLLGLINRPVARPMTKTKIQGVPRPDICYEQGITMHHRNTRCLKAFDHYQINKIMNQFSEFGAYQKTSWTRKYLKEELGSVVTVPHLYRDIEYFRKSRPDHDTIWSPLCKKQGMRHLSGKIVFEDR